MMRPNNRIKVIKRAERESRLAEAAAAAEKEEQTLAAVQQDQTATRNAVTTIKEWVGEMRQKKDAGAGAAHAFKNLFTEAA